MYFIIIFLLLFHQQMYCIYICQYFLFSQYYIYSVDNISIITDFVRYKMHFNVLDQMLPIVDSHLWSAIFEVCDKWPVDKIIESVNQTLNLFNVSTFCLSEESFYCSAIWFTADTLYFNYKWSNSI